MKTVFISQAMNGRKDEEIFREREAAADNIKKAIGDDVVILDSFILEDPPGGANVGLWYLAKSILILSQADIAYFCNGWESARGCKIEHKCAADYGVTIMYDKNTGSKTE